jgi:N-acetylmuramoyl-L-alanine amidase
MTGPKRGRLGRILRWALTGVALLCVVTVAALAFPGFGTQLRRFASAVANIGSPADNSTALDPGGFSTGACVAYTPTVGDNHQTVFLDAGHGGVDPGGVGTTESGQQVEESNVNLAIELDAMNLLRARGYRVVVSRTQDTSVALLTPADLSDGVLSLQGSHDDVVARDVCANLAHADVLVGIYMDAAASGQAAGSVSVYDTARPFASANAQLAGLLQKDVLAAMNGQGWQIPDDGSQPDSGFGSSVGDPSTGGLAAAAAAYNHLLLIGPAAPGYFSSPSAMPGAVIEPLYLTDPFEASIAANPTDQAVIAQGMATAIEQFLKASPSS